LGLQAGRPDRRDQLDARGVHRPDVRDHEAVRPRPAARRPATNYGPTITAYRNIEGDPERVAALDAALADLGDRYLAGSSTMPWEYLLVTAQKR
jgi:hypothetical protein